MDDVYVYLVKLPDGVKEAISVGADGYTVYIDIRLDREHQQKAYDHAMRHIKDGHFTFGDVQRAEAEAHG